MARKKLTDKQNQYHIDMLTAAIEIYFDNVYEEDHVGPRSISFGANGTKGSVSEGSSMIAMIHLVDAKHSLYVYQKLKEFANAFDSCLLSDDPENLL